MKITLKNHNASFKMEDFYEMLRENNIFEIRDIKKILEDAISSKDHVLIKRILDLKITIA